MVNAHVTYDFFVKLKGNIRWKASMSIARMAEKSTLKCGMAYISWGLIK